MNILLIFVVAVNNIGMAIMNHENRLIVLLAVGAFDLSIIFYGLHVLLG